jgi:hypothetical protein
MTGTVNKVVGGRLIRFDPTTGEEVHVSAGPTLEYDNIANFFWTPAGTLSLSKSVCSLDSSSDDPINVA